VSECREQEAKAASVRALAAERCAYHRLSPATVRPVPVKERTMKLELRPFDFAQAAARAGLGVDGQPLAARATQRTDRSGFQQALTQALHSVSANQLEAQRLQREVQLENPNVSLEETMVAMQKAQIGFQATVQVRNRLVLAYTEIMNMQV
jgi:flagellar hook-basal body complex protein FliE